MTSNSNTLLSNSEIMTALETRSPLWALEDHYIHRTWRTENWKATLLLAGAVGHLAELAWHHPEVVLNYASMQVRLHTHDAGGVTEKDLALAEKIDQFLDWNPPLANPALEGTPDVPQHRYIRK